VPVELCTVTPTDVPMGPVTEEGELPLQPARARPNAARTKTHGARLSAARAQNLKIVSP